MAWRWPAALRRSRPQEQLDRTVLPIAEPKPPTYSELDARNAKPPARFEVKAPKGAPNVVIVLIDDVGFGGPSTFGGPIRTPTMDELARSGLRFNNFHTTALCSPTRNALKTSRNHHTANTGSIMETATAFPGNTGLACQNHPPRPMADGHSEAVAVRCLGSLRREERFQLDEEAGRLAAREAGGDAGAVHEGSREVPRVAHR